MIIIYNHRLTNEQLLVEAKKVSSDQVILFQGSEEELNNLGFSRDQVGGFELVNGELTFSQVLKDQQDQALKPILSGEVLGKKLRSLFKGRTHTERKALLSPILTDINILEKDDEVTQEEYDEVKTALISGISGLLTIEGISQIEATLDTFVQDFKL